MNKEEDENIKTTWTYWLKNLYTWNFKLFVVEESQSA